MQYARPSPEIVLHFWKMPGGRFSAETCIPSDCCAFAKPEADAASGVCYRSGSAVLYPQGSLSNRLGATAELSEFAAASTGVSGKTLQI
jgi:hypothetical protein